MKSGRLPMDDMMTLSSIYGISFEQPLVPDESQAHIVSRCTAENMSTMFRYTVGQVVH